VTIINTVREVFRNLLNTYKECESIILSLSFSNEEGKRKSYFGGIRIIKSNIVLSIINITQKELRELEPTIREFKIKYIFIDVEKKLPFEFTTDKASKISHIEYSNIYAEATERLNFAEIVPWSSTDLTCIAAINLLREELGNNLSGNNITIIGLGSIGFQLSLSLIREGVNINCFTKDYTKGLIIANAINTIRSEYTLASFNLYKSLRTAILSSKILIESSSAIHTINKSFIDDFQLHSLILDIGKQAFTKDFIQKISFKNLNFKRLDVSNTISELIFRKLFPSNISEIIPSKSTHNPNVNLISGGWKGLPGDVVVDDAKSPRFVIGTINENFTLEPIYKSFDEWSKSI
tara:strand:- start:1703 stop:2752 length:1050 start_codon:yes stop_codon:yes gene_type:complete